MVDEILALIGSGLGFAYLQTFVSKKESLLASTRLLFLGLSGLCFSVALSVAASGLAGIYQTLVEWLSAFSVVSFILVLFVAGVIWIKNIFLKFTTKKAEAEYGAEYD